MILGNVWQNVINYGDVFYELWIFEVNCPALVQIGLLFQFLCSVYSEKNSKNFIVDCPYYFRIFYKISCILVEYFEFGDFWKHFEQLCKKH